MKSSIFSLLITFLFIFSSCNTAQKYFTKGGKKYEQGEYQFAIENYKQFIGESEKGKKVAKKDVAEAYHRIAESYRLSNRPQEAAEFYEAAIENNSVHSEDDRFWLAYCKKTKGEYKNAIKLFEDYLEVGTDFSKIDHAKKHIENINKIKEINEKLDQFDVKFMENINTDQNEYAPVPYKDKIYFTSSRGEGKVYNSDGTRFTDIYEYKEDGNSMGVVKKLPNIINIDEAHDATAILFNNGNSIIFSRSNVGNRKEASHEVNFYQSDFKNGSWAEPELLSFSRLDAWDSSPFMTKNEKTIYFSSNRDDAKASGGTDLYKVSKNEDGSWGAPINLGPKINTPGNEMFPYVDHEGNFFFSSDGHPGYGAQDLFIAEKSESGSLIVENLGKTINSTFDDFSLYFADDLTGYFTSNRPKNEGDDIYDDDIYHFNYHREVIIEYVLEGKVFSIKEESGDTIVLDGSNITFMTANEDTITSFVADQEGVYTVGVEAEKKYEFGVKHVGYLTDRIEYNTLGASDLLKKTTGKYNVVKLRFNIELKPRKLITLKIKNLLYDFDKSDIRPDAALELDKIVKFLTDNPGISVELGSHTDMRGGEEYNLILSQARAESAVNYIINNGITQDRIAAKGYGESVPYGINKHDVVDDSVSFNEGSVLNNEFINKLETEGLKEEAHQLNRRTELKIVGIKKVGNEIIIHDNTKE